MRSDRLLIFLLKAWNPARYDRGRSAAKSEPEEPTPDQEEYWEEKKRRQAAVGDETGKGQDLDQDQDQGSRSRREGGETAKGGAGILPAKGGKGDQNQDQEKREAEPIEEQNPAETVDIYEGWTCGGKVPEVSLSQDIAAVADPGTAAPAVTNPENPAPESDEPMTIEPGVTYYVGTNKLPWREKTKPPEDINQMMNYRRSRELRHPLF
jgi:hypothetical protein